MTPATTDAPHVRVTASQADARNLLEPGLPSVAVVIPCYRVTRHVGTVIGAIGAEVDRIYCIDDACLEGSGNWIEANIDDPRVMVLRHQVNQGVGGAVMTGYRQAIADGASAIVKIDGDGQMDPALLSRFIRPIIEGEADYAKGNRFYDLRNIRNMPGIRLFGNAILSLMTKLSTGYWDVFDPTNGYTAISGRVVREVPLDKISTRYFFETDMLFRLGVQRAVVVDVPMDALYADEVSNLHIRKIVGEFFFKHVRNFHKRIFYNYFLRDMSIASLELVFGICLLVFGIIYGGYHWIDALGSGAPTATGVIMLSVLPVLMGFQLLLAFFAYDIASVPRYPLTRRLGSREPSK